jgi:hypothetical protein
LRVIGGDFMFQKPSFHYSRARRIIAAHVLRQLNIVGTVSPKRLPIVRKSSSA